MSGHEAMHATRVGNTRNQNSRNIAVSIDVVLEVFRTVQEYTAAAWASATVCGQNRVSVGSQSGQHAAFSGVYS